MSITDFLFGIARHLFLIPGIHGGGVERGCPKSELKLSNFIVEEPKHRKALTIVLCFVFHVSCGATPSGAHGFLLAITVGPYAVWGIKPGSAACKANSQPTGTVSLVPLAF